MTTLALRYRKDYFVESDPTDPVQVAPRSERLGAIHGIPGSPIHEIGAENQHDR